MLGQRTPFGDSRLTAVWLSGPLGAGVGGVIGLKYLYLDGALGLLGALVGLFNGFALGLFLLLIVPAKDPVLSGAVACGLGAATLLLLPSFDPLLDGAISNVVVPIYFALLAPRVGVARE